MIICFSCKETATVQVFYGHWSPCYCEGCAGDVIPQIEDDGYKVRTASVPEWATDLAYGS